MILKCNRISKIFLLACLFVGHGSVDAKTIEIQESSILSPSFLGEVKVFHDEDGFSVEQNGETFFVEKCWTDSSLQDISSEDLEEYLTSGKIFVNQMEDGEFSLRTKLLLKGGGAGGATFGFWLGRAVVYGTVAVVSTVAVVVAAPVVGTVAAGAAVTAAVATVAPIVEGVAQVASVAGAIAVGTGTGPV